MPRGPQGQVRPADAIGNAVLVTQIAVEEIREAPLKQSAKHESGLADVHYCVKLTTKATNSGIVYNAVLARWA